jgi:two-component system chemotaxis sensor kinase CheA
VQLKISGEETEIDRHMVDSLFEPLVYMFRNAIDHEIELPDVRKEKRISRNWLNIFKSPPKGW